MTAATPVTDRVSRVVAMVASVWFAFTAVWGMFGIPGGGHIGAGSAGNVMAAEQIVRWRTIYPLWRWYESAWPDPRAEALCHHPFGQYWVPAFLYWLFGHRDFIVHLPAALMSAAMPPLLYGIAKERWGAAIGAVAAAAYVVVPIAVGFSNFWNLETITIFGSLLFFWGHSRHMTTGKRRYLVASLGGLLVACCGDWVGYLIVMPTLAWAFVRAFVLPSRMTRYFGLEAYARWWALSVIVAVGTLMLWVGLFQHVDHISEWLSAGASRGGGDAVPLKTALELRKAWIDFSFTPLAIALGKIALPVCILRLLVTRNDEETYALGLLFGATLQYVGFRDGADVHIFWPHYFAPYFALALAQLAATFAASAAWVVRRRSPPRTRTVAAVVGLVVGLFPVAAMAHDGVKSLWVWRRTGGRYDDHGTFIRSHVDTLFVIQKIVKPGTPRGGLVDANGSAQWGWEHQWSFQGNSNQVGFPTADNASAVMHPFWLARSSAMSGENCRKIATMAHVRVYGEIWVVDQREPAAPLDAYSLNEREPTAFEWLVYGGTEPMRSIGPRPDPWLTWEWRTNLGQPADPPRGEPSTLDEMRIAHNVAIASDDAAGAARWRERIEQQLDRTVRTSFTSGVELIGVRVTHGVEPRLESWFTIAAPIGEASFDVRAKVEERGAFSLIPPNPTEREMSYWQPPMPTVLWRPHGIYKVEVVLNHLIGRERYSGSWRSVGAPPTPAQADGRPDTTLVVLP